jgi:hypothetical protein
MYVGGITFLINKSFGSLQLIPEAEGLRMCYTPIINGVEDPKSLGYLNLLLPLDAVGGLWATARAFLYAIATSRADSMESFRARRFAGFVW